MADRTMRACSFAVFGKRDPQKAPRQRRRAQFGRHPDVFRRLCCRRQTGAQPPTGYRGAVLPTLIPFAPAHFATLAGWFECETDVVSWGGPFLHFPLSANQLQAMIHESTGAPPGRLCWMAELGGTLVGHAQLVFDWRNGSARLARIAVAPEARGRGLAAQMVRDVVARAFDSDTIERVELNVFVSNTPAIRTYQRVGFVAEGVRRSSTRVGHERWDTAIMAMLRSEWEESCSRSPCPAPRVDQDDAQGS